MTKKTKYLFITLFITGLVIVFLIGVYFCRTETVNYINHWKSLNSKQNNVEKQNTDSDWIKDDGIDSPPMQRGVKPTPFD
jgi:hypothetical protein